MLTSIILAILIGRSAKARQLLKQRLPVLYHYIKERVKI